jgi:hypothetical protein
MHAEHPRGERLHQRGQEGQARGQVRCAVPRVRALGHAGARRSQRGADAPTPTCLKVNGNGPGSVPRNAVGSSTVYGRSEYVPATNSAANTTAALITLRSSACVVVRRCGAMAARARGPSAPRRAASVGLAAVVYRQRKTCVVVSCPPVLSCRALPATARCQPACGAALQRPHHGVAVGAPCGVACVADRVVHGGAAGAAARRIGGPAHAGRRPPRRLRTRWAVPCASRGALARCAGPGADAAGCALSQEEALLEAAETGSVAGVVEALKRGADIAAETPVRARAAALGPRRGAWQTLRTRALPTSPPASRVAPRRAAAAPAR